MAEITLLCGFLMIYLIEELAGLLGHEHFDHIGTSHDGKMHK